MSLHVCNGQKWLSSLPGTGQFLNAILWWHHATATPRQVQQSSTVINVGAPATQTVVLTPSPHPPNYLFLSVFTCLCCVWPLGLAAIVYSCMVDSSYGAGDYAASVRNSNIAKWLNVASILCGIIINIIIVVSVSA